MTYIRSIHKNKLRQKALSTAFTEENIDAFFVQHYISIDEMHLLRNAFDIWQKIQKQIAQ